VSQDLLEQIAKLTYIDALRLQRFEPIGSQMYQGVVGDAMMARMKELQKTTPEAERIAASKQLGWK